LSKKECREGVADHVADVVGDEVGFVDLQRIEEAATSRAWVFLS
jgi:hypothetical protein